jgi:hypothetical protein
MRTEQLRWRSIEALNVTGPAIASQLRPDGRTGYPEAVTHSVDSLSLPSCEPTKEKPRVERAECPLSVAERDVEFGRSTPIPY